MKVTFPVIKKWRPEVADAQECSFCGERIWRGVAWRLWLQVGEMKTKTDAVLCRDCKEREV